MASYEGSDTIAELSADELEKAPAFTFAIEGFVQESGITMLGGKSGDGKTLIAMELGVRPAGHFAPAPSQRSSTDDDKLKALQLPAGRRKHGKDSRGHR